MSDNPIPLSNTILEALIASTSATTHTHATLNAFREEFNESRKLAREQANTHQAKLENLDRSINEMKLLLDKSEVSKREELERIYKLLTEERQDRRGLTQAERDQSTVDKEMFRALIKEEIGERREVRAETRNWIKSVALEVWQVGGKYIVAAVCFVLAALLLKAVGFSWTDLFGNLPGR